MFQNYFRRKIENLLALADVRIGGNRPWDIQVHDENLYQRILTSGSLGLGEMYMDGGWDCAGLDEFFYRVLRAGLDRQVRAWTGIWPVVQAKLVNLQKISRAYEIGQRHYDIGNELFARMLDRRMIYSCGYWKDATHLDEAQEAKLDLVCRKLGLTKGMRLLDIGCGWGGTARFAAERYGAEVVGLTVSEEQVEVGQEICAGLPVEIRLQDYRALDEPFDRILSIGMFEHVGVKNYRAFMQMVSRCLRADGVFLLHTIGRNGSAFRNDPWMGRYIFPNSMLPSAEQISAASKGLFVLEDWHNLGPHYDPTLMAWNDRFQQTWPRLGGKYDMRFKRMWEYYLLSCAGAFRARHIQVWQIALTHIGTVQPTCRF